MVNHMAEVAKMLGVELGECFKCSNGIKYKFTNKGLMTTDIVWSREVDETLFSNVLMNLVNGDLTIMSKPWKPKYNGRYYSIGPGGILESGCWLNDFIDVAMYRLGNCYSTLFFFCLMMQDPYGDFKEIKVVGNIVDNPKLLEVQNEM